jgi:hypothetical protein
MNNLVVYSNKTVSLDGRSVGRIDRDSFQMLSGVKGKTVFFTGKPGTYDRPHTIDAPLYVPAVPGSVSSWKINPAFEAAVRAALA